MEISAADRENNMRAHILGYNIADHRPILKLTRPLLEARSQNSLKQAEILKRHGYRIDLDSINRADGKYLYKQHIMDQLVSTGQVPEMFGAFYYQTFKNGGICDFDIEYIDVIKAVEAVKEAGGQAVLAHSGQQQNFYLIPRLARCGLDGVELNHHANSKKDKKTIREYARKHGLYLTGGSDFHGRYEPQVFGVGDYISEESGAYAICLE
jgi:predicted metal-dependent phosphoesterase TrpH